MLNMLNLEYYEGILDDIGGIFDEGSPTMSELEVDVFGICAQSATYLEQLIN